ncbi:sodium:proton antiporter [Burkholderia singularis]|uniref:Sodium:proton antiporter n=1 Tax=Burkholderia singularis TaxID=1503053 RepID=A0A103E5P0_9BURK|nr:MULTISPECIES: Na+/H+ antiporter [Burkholderia]AOK31349.1 sodium:proton antiporter [Burkholderia sp. Bp7605]KVE28815.1 sodium:proton antiporter [Burkholderia singularis]
MSPVSAFKLVLLSFLAIVALELIAKRLRLPPAAALLVGGAGIAFLPGLPPINLDPELVLIVFLPPLLMDGAYFSVWEEFKRNVGGIMMLAIGAVVFTTLAVGVAVHLAVPALPWAACFALGAIVSPPDAVAAKAVLERVALPRRLMVLLEGESLLNDAAGLVLFRFAVAAALTGAFSFEHALVSFVELGVGGVVVGFIVGWLIVRFIALLDDDYLVITTAVLAAWISYIAGEMCEVSGVIATVTTGMMLGWHQHEIFSASVRNRGTAFWQVIVFLLEALVFVLIGLSLRSVIVRLGGLGEVFATMAPAVLAVLAAVVVSRFVWVFAVECLKGPVVRIARRGPRTDWKAAFVTSWAGMRGVVTLAIALSLPDEMPGRDLILVAAFAVILVTVLLQGTTIGPLIQLLKLRDTGPERHHLTEPQVWARIEAAQLEAIQPHVRDADGNVIHPRLLEQYTYRANLSERLKNEPVLPVEARHAHYDIVLTAIAAGRAELLRLHRGGHIHDEVLHVLERDLDLQEIAAYHAKD